MTHHISFYPEYERAVVTARRVRRRKAALRLMRRLGTVVCCVAVAVTIIGFLSLVLLFAQARWMP